MSGQCLRSGDYMAARRSGTETRSAQSECPRFQGNRAGVSPAAWGGARSPRVGGWFARPRGVPEPDGEAVASASERDVDVQLVRDPQPQSKPVVRCAAWGGDQACNGVGWAVACVVNGDHNAARRGPDTYGGRRAAVAVGVGDCLGDTDQQVLEDDGMDATAGDLRERVPGIG